MGVMVVGGKTVLFDDDDLPAVSARSWFLTRCGYVCTSIRVGVNKRRTLGMHRLIMGDPQGEEVDHLNRNKLDNRKGNLRLCDRATNMQNQDFSRRKRRGKSGLWGVSRNQRGHWSVVVKRDGKAKHYGSFKTKDMAEARARDVFKEVYGESAEYDIA